MALRRSARAGTTVTLRAKIFDDLGDVAQADNVAISIYKPEETISYETGSPVYWDEGIFEYDFLIPEDGPDGLWSDSWTAVLNGETLSGLFTFEVSASGSIFQLDGQLNQNNIVDVIIPSGVLGTDGSVLEDQYEFSFLTTITPKYTDLNKMMVEVGSAIYNLTDDLIYMAILEASLEADQLTFNKTSQNSDFYRHARREWTTCRSAAVLASNIKSRFYAKSKRLGDLEVTYDPSSLDDLLDRIASCLDRWEPQIIAGGYSRQTASMFVKGSLDPDRPGVGRDWDSGVDGSKKVPVGNTKQRESGHRRWKKGFKRRW